MNDRLRVLLVEDSADDADLIVSELQTAGFEFESMRVDSHEAMQAALQRADWDVILSDYNLPQFGAPEALSLMQAGGKDVPFIIVSGCVGDEAAVAMMKAGANDFVLKDSLARLAPAIRRELLEADMRRKYALAQASLHQSEARFRALVSNIPGMVFQMLMDRRRLRFTYASEGCLALFGITPTQLEADSDCMVLALVAEDRESYLRAIDTSATNLATLDWEGRVRVKPDAELKWIAVKAGPRRDKDGDIIWDGITSDITATKAAEQRIRVSEQEFRRLSAHVETLKEEERARVAREIHDDLGGTLTAMKIDLASLANRLPRRSKVLRARVDSVDRLVDAAIDWSARIAADLRPAALDCGIVAAIEWQAREFEERTRIRCELKLEAGEDIVLDSGISIALFRIYQEALTNIAKHAGASLVTTELREGSDALLLRVTDNGCGITDSARFKPSSFGIRGMLERARKLGGNLTIAGAPGKGTVVTVHAPRTVEEGVEEPVEHQYRLL